MRRRSYALALSCLVAGGCTCQPSVQPEAPTATPVSAAPAADTATAVAVAPAAAAVIAAPVVAAEIAPSVTPATKTGMPPPVAPAPTPSSPPAVVRRPPSVSPGVARPASVKQGGALPAAPAEVPPAVASVAPRPAPAPLDFKSLETRLRQTRAIGVMSKLALKNQVDDLLDRFRDYHRRQGASKLADLRRSYELLLLKVLSLLQDSDPPLARDIVKSRVAMWSILEDPRKFTEYNLMAGATP